MDSEIKRERIETEPLLSDPRYISVLSVVILLFTILFWWFFTRKRHQRRSVLLTGLSDSGKTLLFVRLVYSQFRETFTSMKENIEEYTASNKSLRIVDIPGQERLRNKFFDNYKSTAKGVVFVIDSVTIQKEISDVAEYLYTILSDPEIQSNCPNFLILCNKQDQPLAKGSQVIKSLLEKELNVVRFTKSSLLESVDPSQPNKVLIIGKQGKDFEFSHLNFKVEIAECSANTSAECSATTAEDDEPTDLKALTEWISKL